MVDTPDLGSGIERCGGSSPPLGTKKGGPRIAVFFVAGGDEDPRVSKDRPNERRWGAVPRRSG